jgi:rod shape determining protein RodA
VEKSAEKAPAIWQTGSEIKKNQLATSQLITAIFVILSLTGLANLYSAATHISFFQSQARNLAIGFVVFICIGWLIPLRLIKTYAYPPFLITVIALAAVLVIGDTAGGAQRWLDFGGPLRMQPSELAKLTIAIAVAKWFQDNKFAYAYRLRDLWPVLIAAGAIFALIFLQPDLGTAGVCLLIAGIQILFVPLDRKSVLIAGSIGIVTSIIGWSFLHQYQKLRILNLLNPDLDPSGSGYNSRQSLIAIGSGQLFGKGYLQGTQSQLQFLPARQTDFIFSVFAEEHGFWGGVLVFLLFGCVILFALEIGRRARDTFSGLLAIGLASLIFLEFSINVAMVLGIFPVVGMPLPFFSHGGSSLLTMSVALGLLVAIDRDNVGKGPRERKLGRAGIPGQMRGF